MTDESIQQIVLSILTSIITGGFVLVFVEVGNRKQRNADLHNQIMTPYMHKLTAYFRFIIWCQSNIKYPAQLNGYERKFCELIKNLSTYWGKAITPGGGDYAVDKFSAQELEDIAVKINNVWYWYDKMRPINIKWDDRSCQKEDYIKKELKEIDSMYLTITHDIDMIAKVSGDFYTDIYQPISGESYRYEEYQKQYGRQTVFVIISVGIVLMILTLMLFNKASKCFLQISSLLVIVLFTTSLLLLAIDIKKQIHRWNTLIEYIKKIRSYSRSCLYF